MLKPDPTAVLRYNDPKRPRTLDEQIEFAYMRLLDALDKHVADLSSLRESVSPNDPETADMLGGIVADLITITSRNTSLRHKVQCTIMDKLQGLAPTTIKP